MIEINQRGKVTGNQAGEKLQIKLKYTGKRKDKIQKRTEQISQIPFKKPLYSNVQIGVVL